jgi:hypothetical protein
MILDDDGCQQGALPICELKGFAGLHSQDLDDVTGIILIEGQFYCRIIVGGQVKKRQCHMRWFSP